MTVRAVARRSRPARLKVWDAGVVAPLVLICVAALILVSHFFNAFAVPNTDFFAFREHALRYLQFRMPDDFKRLPVFPIVIGVLSRFIPAGEPVLPAALWLNAALTPVALWLAVRVGRRFVGSGTAVMVAATLAVNPTMVFCMTQPLLEVPLLCLILLTLELALRRSRWAYLAAALASLTRYEAGALIPALVIQDLRNGDPKQRRQALGLGALASVWLIIWVAMSAHRHLAVNPYVQEMIQREREGGLLAFPMMLAEVVTDVLPGVIWRLPGSAVLLTVIMALLTGAGVVRMGRRHGTALMVPGIFVLCYVIIHSIFPVAVVRYAVPILWFIYLAIAAALEPLLAHRDGPSPHLAMVAWCASAPLLGYSAWRMLQGGSPALGFSWFLLCVALLWAWVARRGAAGLQPKRGGMLPLVGGLLLAFGVRNTALQLHSPAVADNCAQFKALAAWYRKAARPGDRMAVTLPWVVQYYSGLPDEAFVPAGSLAASTPDAAVAELKGAGVTYIVWDSDYGTDPTTYDSLQFGADLLMQLRERRPAWLVPVHRIEVRAKVAEIFRVR